MVCFPSSHGVGARVMKNCDPLVLGPLSDEFDQMRVPICHTQDPCTRVFKCGGYFILKLVSNTMSCELNAPIDARAAPT